jgi:viroplasmin and RNaseH domain-containing protein
MLWQPTGSYTKEAGVMPRGTGPWFYAVKDPAHVRGVYNDWPTCERKVRGVSGAKFKKFRSMG